MPHRLTTCTFCGVGCGIYLETRRNELRGSYPSMSHPANEGRICVRGWNVHEVAGAPDRIRQPLVRGRSGFEPANWDDTLRLIAERFKEIKAQHGPDSLGFIASPRSSNEETYLLQKFARGIIGTNNVDHSLGAHRHRGIDVFEEMLGVTAATSAISELNKSDVILVDGVDLSWQLPTIGGIVIRRRLAGAKLIVIDPRRHRVAEHADHFMQIRPGNDILLYGAMAKVIVDRGLANLPFIKEHCTNYEAFLESVHAHDVLKAADQAGVTPEVIEEAAIAYATARAGMILYSTGVEARGPEVIRSIVNLALLTGHIGREGAGIMPLAEHNNLQGCSDMGMLPRRLPGYEPVADEDARARLQRLWQSPPLPAAEGLGTSDMIDAAVDGRLKALWVTRHDLDAAVATGRLARALEKLDFLVVQHIFMTETAKHADVILPLVAFGEEQVTFTSTERRIQIADKAVEPPEGPLPAWEQIVRLANAMGARWVYASAAEVMDEITRAVPFYQAATYSNLSRDYGRQWPCTHDAPLGARYLCAPHYSEAPFRFSPLAEPAKAETAPAEYPLALILGRSLYYWHQNVLIQHSETLKREYRILLMDFPEGFVDVSEEDARSLKLRSGSRIRLVTPLGRAESVARVTPEVKAGTVFLPYFLQAAVKALMGETDNARGTQTQPVFVRIEAL